MPQQILRTGFIQHHLTVKTAGNLETGSCRNVGLDERRHDVHARSLGRKHQVDARRTRFLRKAYDQHFHLFFVDENQIRQFVDKADDVGEGL